MTAIDNPFGRVVERVPTATTIIGPDAVAPLPFQRTVLTFPSPAAAQEFAPQIARAQDAVWDDVRKSVDGWIDPVEAFFRSTTVVRTQNEDVAVFSKPPMFF